MTFVLRLSVCLALLTTCADRVVGQVARGARDTTEVIADPADLLSVARSAQALFERRRLRHLPTTLGSSGGACDERVGRFCTWYGEGEWFPVPEADEIVALRAELLATLDSVQRLAPQDGWVLGQRVWYRSETGDWLRALETARACGASIGWWCQALEGFALHGLGRYVASERSYSVALDAMGEGRAEEWRVPEWAVDSRLRDMLQDAFRASESSAEGLLERVWRMADPLYLVEGNDRLTAHYARWTVATIRDRARNPFHISWGRDLDELTVRHGWEMGWERSASRGLAMSEGVIGHKHPEGRDFVPSGRAVENPTEAPLEAWEANKRRPRSLYAPAYAPVLLPMDGQLAVFPRGERMAIVATAFLPEDTTFHVDHGHELPWMDPGRRERWRDRTGLFAVPVDGGRRMEVVTMGSAEGPMMMEVPVGSYFVSSESWSPGRTRAGRLRRGVAARVAPEDIATLSDILLLRPPTAPPGTLEEALDAALVRPVVQPGEPFAIGWEVAGLGFRPEVFHFEVSVTRTDRAVLSRVGDFLRLTSPPKPLVLSWEEPGPEVPGHHFRYLDLDVPGMEPGRYEIRLVLRSANRTDAVTTRELRVVDPRESGTR